MNGTTDLLFNKAAYMASEEISLSVDITQRVTSSEIPAAGDDLPVLGIVNGEPTPIFYIIHIVAISSCSISSIFSAGVIIFLFISERRSAGRSFFRWTIGERLVIYLAMFDLGQNVCHSSDHAYYFITRQHPPKAVCQFFSFVMMQNILGQGLIVLFTATSALGLVIFQKKIKLGRNDWKLAACVVVLPLIYDICGLVYNYLGTSGAWCVPSMRNDLGRIMNNVFSAILMSVFFSSALSYIIIWTKMKASGPKSETNLDIQRKKKYHSISLSEWTEMFGTRSAKMMVLFMVAYMMQWVFNVVYSIWAKFEEPQIWVFIAKVIFCNLGGLFNGLAYTVMRRRYLKAESNVTGTGTMKKNTTTTYFKESDGDESKNEETVDNNKKD